jgi:hypothetical protein
MPSTSSGEASSRSAAFSAGAGRHAAATSAELTECRHCGAVRASEPQTGGMSAEDVADSVREVSQTGSAFLIDAMQRQID